MTFRTTNDQKTGGGVSVGGPFNRGIAVSWTVSCFFSMFFSKWKVWCDGNLRRSRFLKKKKNSGVHRNTPFSMGKVFAKLQENMTTLRWMVLLMVKRYTAKQWKYVKHRVQLLTRWWFQIFFGFFITICGGFPFWLIFFNWFNRQPVKSGSIILLILEASPDFPKSAKTKDASSKKNVCEGSRYLVGICGWDLFQTGHYNPYLHLPHVKCLPFGSFFWGDGFQEELPFLGTSFQVPCQISGV